MFLFDDDCFSLNNSFTTKTQRRKAINIWELSLNIQ